MSVTVLVVDDEEDARLYLSTFLTKQGYEVLSVGTLQEARQKISEESADIILLDVQLPDGYGPSLLIESTALPVRPPIILITAYGDIDMAVDAMKNGAHDFLQKPIQLERLLQTIQRAEEIVAMRRELSHFRQTQHQDLDFIVGKSPAMQSLLKKAQRVATASVSLLITGETGTGKDVLARATHQMGVRANKPFVAVNCAAIQATMLESELFGHEAGAFTGAEKKKHGLMEVADGGILFLDEIASMPDDMQAKLLRALESHTIRRVGGNNEVNVDVQIIAASNRVLTQLVANHMFREDLYYRLKVVDLHLPPLRERKEDIPDLVGLFIRHNNVHKGLNISDITPRAMSALINYDWPGNIRELRNVIERAMLFCDDPVLDLPHFSGEIFPEIAAKP